ncbi:MAG: sugar O-acetyltransferase [Eubacterium sp.]
MSYLDVLKGDQAYVINNSYVPRQPMRDCHELCWKINHLPPDKDEEKREAMQKLFGEVHDSVFIMPEFHCDYGFNIYFHGMAYVNYNAVFLDTSPIHIGNNAFIAPGALLSCAGHSIDKVQRARGISTSASITLEDDVWLGARVTVIGGVTIGKGTVIGAGSVVTKDIPAGVVAAGVPCRVIRKITEEDRLALTYGEE